ncbi:MAG: toxin-antitoxin system YwqK family antitoxin [Rhabdochlamydiaceae bacterium]
MKLPSIIYLAFMSSLLLVTTSCSKKQRDQDNIVSQKYFHKYGENVSQKEWFSEHLNGHIVTSYKNGVTVSSEYDNGVLHGITKKSHPHSQVPEKIQLFDNGELIKDTTFDSRGTAIKEISHLSANKQKVFLWYGSGVPQSEEIHENGKLIEGHYFSPKNEKESSVENGQGVRLEKNRDGLLLAKEYFSEGMITMKETFHPNGFPSDITLYQNGLIHGEKRSFNEKGEPLCVQEYMNGSLNGKTTYFKDGIRSQEIFYLHGKKNGLETHYLDGEHPSQEISWLNDKKHGASTFYANGDVSTSWFYEGEPVSAKRFKELNRIDQKLNEVNSQSDHFSH